MSTWADRLRSEQAHAPDECPGYIRPEQLQWAIREGKRRRAARWDTADRWCLRAMVVGAVCVVIARLV